MKNSTDAMKESRVLDYVNMVLSQCPFSLIFLYFMIFYFFISSS